MKFNTQLNALGFATSQSVAVQTVAGTMLSATQIENERTEFIVCVSTNIRGHTFILEEMQVNERELLQTLTKLLAKIKVGAYDHHS